MSEQQATKFHKANQRKIKGLKRFPSPIIISLVWVALSMLIDMTTHELMPTQNYLATGYFFVLILSGINFIQTYRYNKSKEQKDSN